MKRAKLILFALVTLVSGAESLQIDGYQRTRTEYFCEFLIMAFIIVILLYPIYRCCNQMFLRHSFLHRENKETSLVEYQKQSTKDMKKAIKKAMLILFSLVTLAIIGYLGYLHYQLYRENNAKALITLYNYGFRDFGKVDLKIVRLEKVNLQKIDLQGADLQGAKLSGLWQEADLLGANLKDTELQAVDFSLAGLQEANLKDANLQGAILFSTWMEYADLQDANLQSAVLRSADLYSANLKGANLQDAYMLGAILATTNLQNANLRGANLKDACLRDANLQNANLSGANLSGADLEGASITIEQVSSCEYIENAKYLSSEFLLLVKKRSPKLMKWWHAGMKKEIIIDIYGLNTDDDGWTGRWIEPPTSQADKQSEQ